MSGINNNDTNLDNCVPIRSNTIYSDLVKLVGGIVERHRNDLLVHDAREIASMRPCKFIHVSYVSGTHLYELPTSIEDDTAIKYLFGMQRPSMIYQQNLSLIEDYFGRPEFFGYEHSFAYSDGDKVICVSQVTAISIYRSALQSVLAELSTGRIKAKRFA